MAQRSQLPMPSGGFPFARAGLDPFSIMDRLLGEVARGGGLPGMAETPALMTPRIDISETDSDIKVCAELPGIDEKDVEVTVTDDLLSIRGEKRIERDESRENFHLVERAHGSFARNIRLPFKVDTGEVQADFENGVLTITVPKPAEQQPRSSRIAIRSAGRSGASSGPSLKSAADEMRSANAPETGKAEEGRKAGSGAKAGADKR